MAILTGGAIYCGTGILPVCGRYSAHIGEADIRKSGAIFTRMRVDRLSFEIWPDNRQTFRSTEMHGQDARATKNGHTHPDE
jgi:hypothetical protein